jgi:hypothetical protein
VTLILPSRECTVRTFGVLVSDCGSTCLCGRLKVPLPDKITVDVTVEGDPAELGPYRDYETKLSKACV